MSEVRELVTTPELLAARQEETGVAGDLLLQIVAKSAVVRHLATGPRKDAFVLKGGTLLHHVYGSPRQSVRDADYAYIATDRDEFSTVDLEAALRVGDDEGFYLHLDDADWDPSDGILEAKGIPFTIEGIKTTPSRAGLDVSVSVRPGERMLEPKDSLTYVDPLLYGSSSFEVNGLTLEEMCAEKVIGWVSRLHTRHYLDLGFVAREREPLRLDADTTVELVARKFAAEKKAPRFKDKGITNLDELRMAFNSDPYLEGLRKDWDSRLGTEIFFLPHELEAGEDRTLARIENVERFVGDFWVPLLDQLAGPRKLVRDGSSGRRLPVRRS